MMKSKIKIIVLSVLLITSLTTFGQNVRGFYLQDVGTWLGNTTSENEILQYAQGNGFNYILFYDLGDINWSSSTKKNQLGAFISKARTQYGIIQIGGVVEYAGYVSQYLIPFNNTRTSNTEKFDVINLEFEFWVTSSITSSYCTKFLSAAGYSCDKAGAWQFAWKQFKLIDDLCIANSMISEIYLGWPDLSQMQQIASRADRILLSAYRPTDSDIYAYSKQRMKDIATIGGSTKVLTLLSSESIFMGPWLNSNPQSRPFQTMTNALNAETGTFKQNINFQGYQWFTYKYMPKTILATATISSSGPLTFCPGGSVNLTANTGTAYLWSPGGQTTQTITVTTAGSYTVRVTHTNGTSVVSLPAIVSTSGTGTAPTVSVSGPTSFCPGGSVTLTSNVATSYLWSNGETTQSITVTNSGSFTVTTGGGSCSGTSAPVVVNASSAPSIPNITENASLNVCPGTTLTLTSSASNGYLWSNGATTRSIVVSTGGNYTVKAYTGPNCFAQSAVKTVTLLSAPAKPTITASTSTTLTTTNPSVVLTSSTASAYLWSTASANRSITVTTQGSYRVTVTGSNGCKATSNELAVIANGCIPPPSPTITLSGSGVIISGQSVVLTSSLSGGYLWSTGAQTRSITISTAGTYSVRSYNKGGCFSTSLPVSITVILARIENSSNTENSDDMIDNNSDRFTVYPNPVRDQLNIVFNQSEEKNINISLLDITGRMIQNYMITSVTGENRFQIDVSAIPRGIYFTYLLSDDKKQVMKVVVE
jgi:hypothetical protein